MAHERVSPQTLMQHQEQKQSVSEYISPLSSHVKSVEVIIRARRPLRTRLAAAHTDGQRHPRHAAVEPCEPDVAAVPGRKAHRRAGRHCRGARMQRDVSAPWHEQADPPFTGVGVVGEGGKDDTPWPAESTQAGGWQPPGHCPWTLPAAFNLPALAAAHGSQLARALQWPLL